VFGVGRAWVHLTIGGLGWEQASGVWVLDMHGRKFVRLSEIDWHAGILLHGDERAIFSTFFLFVFAFSSSSSWVFNIARFCDAELSKVKSETCY
jgi:hypothetical protein